MKSLKEEILILRSLLFHQHPCEGKYGDDGEMQCGSCGIDFKRMAPSEIERLIILANLRKLANSRKLDVPKKEA